MKIPKRKDIKKEHWVHKWGYIKEKGNPYSSEGYVRKISGDYIILNPHGHDFFSKNPRKPIKRNWKNEDFPVLITTDIKFEKSTKQNLENRFKYINRNYEIEKLEELKKEEEARESLSKIYNSRQERIIIVNRMFDLSNLF